MSWVRKENVNGTVEIFTYNKKNESSPLHEETIKSLKMKCPGGKQVCKEFLQNDRMEDVHPIKN